MKPTTRRVWVRNAREVEKPVFEHWAYNTKDNLFDPEVMTYPTTETYVAHAEGTPIVFMPVQTTLTLESLAINPEAEKSHVAVSLKALLSNIATMAGKAGLGEVYFLCHEPSTIEFAEKNGLERIPWPVFRLKLSSLERPHENLSVSNS